MSRTRQSAKKAGASFERLVADYLRDHVDDRIDRRPKTGAKDRGDIGGVRVPYGGRVVVECKNTSRACLSEWVGEAEIERGNDDALVGVVVHKRHGRAAAGEQFVTMRLVDFAALLSGERPDMEGD